VFNLTLPGAIHTVLAALAIAFGIVQFCRPKGDPLHRAVGYGYVGVMLIADGAAMLVVRFTGKFNIFHAGAIVNMVCICVALLPVLARPRRPGWGLRHYYWMSWSYVGLLAAAATELVVRTAPLANRAQAWAATIAATLAVTLVGYMLINRHRPIAAR